MGESKCLNDLCYFYFAYTRVKRTDGHVLFLTRVCFCARVNGCVVL